MTLPTRDEAWARLHDISVELGERDREYAFLRQEEARGKADAWQASVEGSVAGREKDSEVATLDLRVQLLELRGIIDALTWENDFLRFYLEHYFKDA